jgi:hypothetical protein
MYYIYHIEGVKIGCSKTPNKRVKRQGYTQYTILEQHNDINIAAVRERELQIEYGYGKDNPILYNQADYVELGRKMGFIQGKKNVESGQLKSICKEGGKAAGKLNLLNGHMERMRELTNYNKKDILAYDRFTNELIGEYESLSQCGRELQLRVPKISECVNGKRKWHRNYTFKYKA